MGASSNLFRETLKKLRETSHAMYVPSHTKPTGDITALVDRNLGVVEFISSDVLGFLGEPKTVSEIQSQLCTCYGLDLDVVQQYLINTTIMAYLSYLYEEKTIEIQLEDNSLRWARVR